MLKNFKISARLVLGFTVVTILLVVVFFMGYRGMNNLSDDVDSLVHDGFPKTIWANQLIDNMNQLVLNIRNLYILDESEKAAREKELDSVKDNMLTADKLLDSLKATINSEKGKELVHKIDVTRKANKESRDEFIKLVLNNRKPEAKELLFGELQKRHEAYFNSVENLIEFQTDKMNKAGDEADNTYREALIINIIISVIAIIIAIMLALTISRSISKPINSVLNAANQIAKGNLNLNLEIKSKDETGMLTDSMKKMTVTIKELVSDTKSLAQAGIDGTLNVRADSGKYEGEFKNVIEGINKTLDAVAGPMNMAAENIDRISKGDIPEKITAAYNGDFNLIKNNLNMLIETLNTMNRSLNQTIIDQKQGEIDSRCRLDGLQGMYINLMKGINETLDIVLNPIIEGTGIMNEYAQGDLTKEMRKLPGKQIVLTEGLNNIRKNILALITDTQILAATAVEGKLTVRADTNKHLGDYRRIIEGLNKTLDAIIDPINEAGHVLSVMATGDLTIKMTGSYQGDHQKLKDSINTVNDSLNNLLKEVTEVVQNSASAAVQISSTSETMAAGAAEQSAQADEVASAVEQMTRTITQNAMNATKTAEVAEGNGQIAKEGESVVDQTVNKMKDIANVVKKSAESIEKLGESSKEIGEIISVIDDIADQTNLLALNAAIEAARAGDQGRGFAVVADEVRKLAERTTEATKRIASMIKGIQKETEEAVKGMQKGNEEVTNGIVLADRAGKSLSEVVKSSEEVQDMIAQIAAASEEQSATSEQIARNVQTISSVSAESARNVQDIASASNDLAQLTENLSSLMSKFKIENSASNAGSKADIYNGNGKSLYALN